MNAVNLAPGSGHYLIENGDFPGLQQTSNIGLVGLTERPFPIAAIVFKTNTIQTFRIAKIAASYNKKGYFNLMTENE